jgi:anti-sigma factor RsiW
MCDERERLLEYLYDDCAAREERRAVERHLASCEACRTEISELRAVRLDLLAWDVPEHESVWKPFAPPRVKPWYREVPAWAYAAAAGVMFALGMAGGIVSRSWAAPAYASGAALPAASAIAPSPAAARAAGDALPFVTVSQASADLAAMEARIVRTMEARLEQRLRPIAAHAQQAAGERSGEQVMQEVRALLAASEARQNQAVSRAVMSLLADSQDMFVTNKHFNTFKEQDLPSYVRVSYERGRQ